MNQSIILQWALHRGPALADGSRPRADAQPNSKKPVSFSIKMDNTAIIFITFKDGKKWEIKYVNNIQFNSKNPAIKMLSVAAQNSTLLLTVHSFGAFFPPQHNCCYSQCIVIVKNHNICHRGSLATCCIVSWTEIWHGNIAEDKPEFGILNQKGIIHQRFTAMNSTHSLNDSQPRTF